MRSMYYWLDTEFIEDGKIIDLLSIGIVAEDGREFYVQVGTPTITTFGPMTEAEAAYQRQLELDRANDWVKANVLPHLQPTFQPRASVREMVRGFCNPETHGKPEFWGYYAAYDWVALCQLFGTMMDLPKGWPKYCHDIKQWCDDLGNPKLPERGKGEHHALADARWNKTAWEFLDGIARP